MPANAIPGLYDLPAAFPLSDTFVVASRRGNDRVTDAFLTAAKKEVLPGCPYDVVQFVQQSHRYIAIFRQMVDETEERLRANGQINATMTKNDWKPPNFSFQDLSDSAKGHLDRARFGVLGLEGMLRAEGTIVTMPETMFPNVSPREILYWIRLNGKSFRAKIDATRTRQELEDVMKTVPTLLKLGSRALMEGRVTSDKNVPLTCPKIFFVCTGKRSNGTRAHELVHVGATQERVEGFRAFHLNRRGARSTLIEGTADPWKKAFETLLEAEKHCTTDEERHEFRVDVMTSPQPRWPLLRACNSHLGQAYMWEKNVTEEPREFVEAIGCCYVCKATIAYKELARDSLKETKRIRLKQRAAYPNSCAEVAASQRCDLAE